MRGERERVCVSERAVLLDLELCLEATFVSQLWGSTLDGKFGMAGGRGVVR